MKCLKKMLSHLRGEQDVEKLIKKGLVIGKNCKLGNCHIDPSHCFHISIGDNVTFGPKVRILAHDASTKLLLGYTRVANVHIGSNVFIGSQSIVLPGVTIGDNVIVGAGSVVTHDIPSNSVAVGAPARVIKSLTEYLEKRRQEMNREIVFGEEYTFRNPSFNAEQRRKLKEVCDKYGQIYIE
jgi:maltose O-acetyltransferase